MVAPHSEWDDTEAGYRNDDTLVAVRPISIRWTEANGKPKSREGYEVTIEYGYQSRRSMATFTDPRTAWEFANLLTHYLDRRTPIRSALLDLSPEYGETDGKNAGQLPKIVDELSAVETLKKLAGRYSYVVDEILPETDSPRDSS